MTNTIKYTKAPKEIAKAIDSAVPVLDFLPSPDQLVKKLEKEKSQSLLDKSTVDFFKREADKYNVGYQTQVPHSPKIPPATPRLTALYSKRRSPDW